MNPLLLLRLAIAKALAGVGLKLWPYAEPFFKKHSWAAAIMIVIWFSVLLAVLLGVGGCAGLPTSADPATSPAKSAHTYRHDLKVKVNGVKFYGTGVAAAADQYEVKVYPDAKIDRIIWQTCHQEQVVDRPERGFWEKIQGEHEFKFTLTPSPGVEDSAACALEIRFLEEKRLRKGFAVIEFQDRRPEVSLPAVIKCNGRSEPMPLGVSLCQSAVGLVQRIEFDRPVVLPKNKKPGCDVVEASADERTYTFWPAPGVCTYYFTAQGRHANGKRLLHRLNVVGYTEVDIKE